MDDILRNFQEWLLDPRSQSPDFGPIGLPGLACPPDTIFCIDTERVRVVVDRDGHPVGVVADPGAVVKIVLETE